MKPKIIEEMIKRFIEICVDYILHFEGDKFNIQTKNKSGIYNKKYYGL